MNDHQPQRISAAHLKVPRRAEPILQTPPVPPAPSASKTSAGRKAIFYERLECLIEACGPKQNKHDLVIVLISACIAEGVNTSNWIIGTLANLGFNRKHVAIQLRDGTGNDPAAYRWRRDAAGVFELLSQN